MSNLSIFAQNTCAGLSDEAQALYLRGAGRDEQKAFWMACKWDDVLSGPIMFMCQAAADGFAHPDLEPKLPTNPDDVYDFIKERHYRAAFPDGRNT
jgi:hypothetical protein